MSLSKPALLKAYRKMREIRVCLKSASTRKIPPVTYRVLFTFTAVEELSPSGSVSV